MRACSKCGSEIVGRPRCVTCARAYQRAWYLKNQEQVKKRSIEWVANNRDRKRAADQAYYATNKETLIAKSVERSRRSAASSHARRRRWYEKNRAQADAATKKWMAEHVGEVRARARRIKTKRKECQPLWASQPAMAAFYHEAVRLSRETGIPHEVDHIVPLLSPVVCGLHCEANLRVVPRAVNRAKSNRLIDDRQSPASRLRHMD